MAHSNASKSEMKLKNLTNSNKITNDWLTGEFRGWARAGGELFRQADQWIINNESSFEFMRVEKATVV